MRDETGSSSPSIRMLALGAMGVVFGDIGTSPLYAFRECFYGMHAIRVSEPNVLGVLSLVFWSLTVVVSGKYLLFLLRADNRGEGGIFALLALVPSGQKGPAAPVVLAALFGASLLYGDGMITPAISVLSAVEGIELATASARPFVLPLTVVILFGLFMVQRHGTAGIGRVFGPITLVWFLSIGALGLNAVIARPEILAAIHPLHAFAFFADNGRAAFVVLGSVVLVITGSEALYADMGHFGRGPIRRAWFFVVFPALLLNYFGQGALLLSDPSRTANPFYGLVPHALLYPMVALATVAAVIASQALITGAFSLTRAAVQLGYLPRAHIVHTSGEREGQIYIPEVNKLLMVACLTLVLGFRDSSRLAAAYGVAVTLGMVLTSIVFFVVAMRTWSWPLTRALPLVALFLLFELPYFAANLVKFTDGGWFPIAVAITIFIVMSTWKRGRMELAHKISAATLPLELFLADLQTRAPLRVPGTAVFMSSSPTGTPPVLLHQLKHNQVLHEQVVLLSIRSADVPTVAPDERLTLEPLGQGLFRLTAEFGFAETPNVPEVMRRAYRLGLASEPASTSYFLGRETLLTSGTSKLPRWRKELFGLISRNSRSATAYFGLPPGRVVELGMQVEL